MQFRSDRGVYPRRGFAAEHRGGTTIEYAALLGLLVALAIAAAVSLIGSTRSVTQSVTEYFMVGSGDGASGRNGHLGDSNGTAQYSRPVRDDDRSAEERSAPPEQADGATAPAPPTPGPGR